MAEYEIIPKATIDAIEESIQRKRGETAPISPSQMPLAIDTIPSSVDGTDAPVGGIYFTKPDSNGNPTEMLIVGLKPSVEIPWVSTLSDKSCFPYISGIKFIECDNIVSFLNEAFNGNAVLESIVCPDSIKTISFHSFMKCTSLVNISVPKTLSSIGVEAFYSCSLLKTFHFPKTLSSIGDNAFRNCFSLENITFENGFNCNNLNLSASTRYTAETIVSWLEALADRTGQATFTLTIGSTNLAKLTAEQKAIATNKNWTLA